MYCPVSNQWTIVTTIPRFGRDTLLPLFAESGGTFTALNKTVTVLVSDDALTIEFTRSVQNPTICAIEIHPVSTATVSSAPSMLPSQEPSGDGTAEPSFSQAPSWFPTRVVSMFPSLAPSNEPSQISVGASGGSQVPTNTRSGSSSTSLQPSLEPTITLPAFEPIHINAGGSTYVDSKAIKGKADNSFNTGKKYYARGAAISGTEDDELFRSERYDVGSAPELVYNVTVPNGDYKVTLYFSENYAQAAGRRVFDVSIEGNVVLPSFDIYKEANGSLRALNKTATISVRDGVLTIGFARIIQNPKVNAIQTQAATTTSDPSVGTSNALSMVPSIFLSMSTFPSLEPSSIPTRLGMGAPSWSESSMPSLGQSSPEPSSQPSRLSSTVPSEEFARFIHAFFWRFRHSFLASVFFSLAFHAAVICAIYCAGAFRAYPH